MSDAERRRDEAECVSRASREATAPTTPTMGGTTGTPIDPQRTRMQTTDVAALEECMKGRGYREVTPGRPPG